MMVNLYIRNEKSKKLFLKMLEEMYSIGDGLSIEESASFNMQMEKTIKIVEMLWI